VLKYYLQKALASPPQLTLRKLTGKIRQKTSEALMRQKDRKDSSYEDISFDGDLFRYLPVFSEGQLWPLAGYLPSVTRHYLSHRFDLLGSGWVQVYHGMRCRGLEGYRYEMGEKIKAGKNGEWLAGGINSSNAEESRRIWGLVFQGQSRRSSDSGLVPAYVPIDWHLDFKSGYRWPESTWYKDIRYGHKLGVDVKVPWELARMQHLPQLALAYAISARGLKAINEDKMIKTAASSETLPVAGNENNGKQGGFHDSLTQRSAGFADASTAGLEGLKITEPQWKMPEEYAREFRSQVLDFIATNPPRYGVNWRCAMDVGIRVANWLVAYDIFRAHGMQFDGGFENVFKRSVYEHGLHIINNLEWGESLRSNHYLSDIAGLLFVAAYLPCTPRTNAWLAFAVQELVREVETQFYPDGGNFEASTSYHRLSAELVIYSTALVLGLPPEKWDALKDYDRMLIKGRPGLKPSPIPRYDLPVKPGVNSSQSSKSDSPFPPWYFERLEKMAEFTMHITKPNGHIPQIGDNDSGRFLKLQPVYNKTTVAEAKKKYLNLAGYDELPDDEIYWDEDFLDHRHLVAAINGLFGRDDFAEFSGGSFIEAELINRLAGGITLSSYRHGEKTTAAERVRIGNEGSLTELQAFLEGLPDNQRQTTTIPLPAGAADNLALCAYPDFGLYIYRSERLYIAVRCGSVGQNGNGGHAHNDQLSIELNVDGKDLITDPGTYLYTPLPERRNEYRSVKAHFAPQVAGREQGDLNVGLFKIGGAIGGECAYFGSQGFVGKHSVNAKTVWRTLHMMKGKLTITDYASEYIPRNIANIWISQGTTKEAFNISVSYGMRCG
jgi:hypothetical protein